MRLRSTNFGRVVTGIIFGLCARFVYEQLRNFTKSQEGLLFVDKENKHEKNTNCNTDECCTLCPPTKVEAETPSYVVPVYKPKGMYEVTRWIYFDKTYAYDMISAEPKVEITGHWQEEIKAVTQVAVEYLNSNHILGQKWSLAQIQNGYVKTDSIRGTDYILDLAVTPVALNSSFDKVVKVIRVRLVHPIENINESKMISIKRELKGTIKVVVPVKPGSKDVLSFVEEYVTTMSEEDVGLILVLFMESTRKTDLLQHTEESLKQKIAAHPKANIQLTVFESDYDYYSGIQYGVTKAASKSDIILAIEEDMTFSTTLLDNCRSIAVPGQRAYFPIAFSQFNPDIVERGMPPGKPKKINEKEHTKFTGYWMHETHDYFCSYQQDFINILSNVPNMKLKSSPRNWVYNAFLDNDILAASAVEPHLFKKKFEVQCNNIKSATAERQQCFKLKAKSLGSKPALGILYINEVMQRNQEK